MNDLAALSTQVNFFGLHELFRKASFLYDTTNTCQCQKIDLNNLKGRWLQILASTKLANSLYKAVGVIFDENEPVELSCTELKGSFDTNLFRSYSLFLF